MTIFGWDASDFDWDRGPMDLGAARAAGIDFFTHKATESTNTRHKHYGEVLQRARAAGIPFLGAYHVVRSNSSITAQVDYLLAYADAATPWWRNHPGWFWQCDLEKWSYDAVPAQRGVDFCVELSSRTNRATLLYAPKWAYGDGVGGQAPLWASNYVTGTGGFKSLYPGDGSGRWAAYSGRTPVILQYTSSATIGRQPMCDANAFRGSVADFARLIGAHPATLEGDITMGDFDPYGPPPGNPRQVGVYAADLWGQEMLGTSPYGGNAPSQRTQQLGRLEAKLDATLKALGLAQADIDELQARPAVQLTDEQAAAQADRIAAALVAHPDTPLGDADKPVIVAAVQQALREGVGSA